MSKSPERAPTADPDSAPREVFPGVFMIKTKSEQTMTIDIENRLFKVLEVTIDFSKSTNLKLDTRVQNATSVSCVIEPFERKRVAKLILSWGWKLKTTFQYALNMPPFEAQTKALKAINDEIEGWVLRTKLLQNIDTTMVPEGDIFEFLRDKKLLFVDQDFLPNSSALGLSLEVAFKKFQAVPHFKRASTLYFGKEIDPIKDLPIPSIVNRQLRYSAVRQGLLDNCWFVAALAALTKHQRLIERLFLTKKPNKYGFYKLKLTRMNVWTNVVIDDFLPCFPLGELMFTSYEDGDLWPALVEKALAKLKGGYEYLEGGQPANAFVTLTGCPTFQCLFEDPRIDHWGKLMEAMSAGYLVVLGSKQDPKQTNGFIPDHAYNVVRLHESPKQKLVKVSTGYQVPGVWSGEYAKDGTGWTTELLVQVNPDFQSDKHGFWMSMAEVLENFSFYTICKVAQWEQLNMRGKFVTARSEEKTAEDPLAGVAAFCTRWTYTLEITNPSTLIFGVHQQDERCAGHQFTAPFVDIGLAVCRVDAEGHYHLHDLVEPEFSRQVFLEAKLPPGKYIIVPYSTGISMHFPRRTPTDKIEFRRGNPMVMAALKEIFHKFDSNLNRLLNYSEIKGFYQMMSRELTETDFEFINERYGRRDPLTGEIVGVTESGFFRLFLDLFQEKFPAQIFEIFAKFGYDQNLYSWRTRGFVFSCHADVPVHLKMEDALSGNFDAILQRLLLKKLGRKVNVKVDMGQRPEGSGEGSVECFKYVNL